MKVTLNWLKQYVDFNWSPEELTERLTMLGLEVEGMQKDIRIVMRETFDVARRRLRDYERKRRGDVKTHASMPRVKRALSNRGAVSRPALSFSRMARSRAGSAARSSASCS